VLSLTSSIIITYRSWILSTRVITMQRFVIKLLVI
jgi:hypothetical protein